MITLVVGSGSLASELKKVLVLKVCYELIVEINSDNVKSKRDAFAELVTERIFLNRLAIIHKKIQKKLVN